MTTGLTDKEKRMALSVGWTPGAPPFSWTKDQVDAPLRPKPFADLVAIVKDRVEAANLVIPDVDPFIRRTVSAVLAGHVVFQGPPGTGKTTFARILAEAFDAILRTTTATAEWSTYDVVGGLRPSRDGGLVPVLGAVAAAALECAETVQSDPVGGPPAANQAVWLLIDELNRADIDKAIGSLYTVLSSISKDHLRSAPLELWFENDGRRELWVPSRFRIIGTMNDVDTSYVNTISQGLTRRFQFITLSVSTDPTEQQREVRSSLLQAAAWVSEHRALPHADDDVIVAAQASGIEVLVELLTFVRSPENLSWPLGTAQIVSVWRTALISLASLTTTVTDTDLDGAIADLVIPQAGALNFEILTTFHAWLEKQKMTLSARAVRHLMNTSSPF